MVRSVHDHSLGTLRNKNLRTGLGDFSESAMLRPPRNGDVLRAVQMLIWAVLETENRKMEPCCGSGFSVQVQESGFRV